MSRSLTIALFLTLGLVAVHATQNVTEEDFTLTVLTTGLEYPWEVAWGPDGHLWVTERTAKRVTRVNLDDGSQSIVVTIPDAYQSVAQDGVLGLALHPRLLQGSNEDFVYVAYTYLDGVDTYLKVQRFSYDRGRSLLERPIDIITGLPAHDDHLGGRLGIGPDEKLYLTIGDQGSNWLQNYCNLNLAQGLPAASDTDAGDWRSYEGKILRLNLDGTIPADNPLLDGVRSHIFSYGHRNPQGLAFGVDGLLYASEHGPSTDDELNLVESGGNYGWPQVAGYQDDQSYSYFNWSASRSVSCSELTFSTSQVPASVPRETESAWNHPDFRAPIQTLFTVPSDWNFRTQGGATIAPSSLGIYSVRQDGIPGWADSLLVPGMIKGRMYRQQLSTDGRSAVGTPVELFRTTNRYRDLAINPDGRTIYIATDNAGRTTGRSGVMTDALEHPGAIIQFRFGD
ncbi:MAG: glucose/sorbosone family PQQ-dependent dehydrogenase [Acidobacteriota bacterium]|nr:glucose/sorbosone family PQQ-dependent dehydrogenase [Acidobacteriota bacterium]